MKRTVFKVVVDHNDDCDVEDAGMDLETHIQSFLDDWDWLGTIRSKAALVEVEVSRTTTLPPKEKP